MYYKVMAFFTACSALAFATAHAATFTSGNIVVEVAQGTGSNVATSVQEITSAGSTTGLQNISIPSTGSNAFRISAQAGTSGFLSLSADGTLLTLTGANSSTTSGNENALSPRAVATFDNNTNFSIATTYTGSSGEQERAATTIYSGSYYIADQGGLYTNNAVGNDTEANNLRSIRSFGGVVYVCSADATGISSFVSTVPSPTAASFTALPGLSTDSHVSDFYMISSGSNGSAYDILYELGTQGLKKYSLVNGTWTANGTDANAIVETGFSIAAVSNGSGGVNIYISTSNGTASNKVISLTDQAGYNTTINDTPPITIYSVGSANVIKGIAFAPVPVTIAATGSPTPVNTTLGTASLPTSFSVSATSLTNNLVITPPPGFEVSTSSSSGYSGSVTLTQSGGTVAFTTIYLRLAASTAVGTYSGNIVCSSTGVNSVYVPTLASTVSLPSGISTTGTPVALSTTYGAASTTTTFSVAGSSLTNNITVTAPTGFEISTSSNSGFSSSFILTQSGGTVPSTPVYVRLAATTGAGNYSGNVTLVSAGTTSQNVPIPSSTVGKVQLTVSGAAVTTKPWDGTTVATITGTLVGLVNNDAVTLVGVGAFSSANDGTWAVTPNCSLAGTAAANYTLVQPTGLSGTIQPSDNLSNVTVNEGNLTPAFAYSTTSYSTGLPSNTGSINITPTADASATSITVNGSPATNGSPSGVTLHSGANVITVVVTASGGATQTYTFTVNLAAPFTPGNVVVQQADNGSLQNTTITMVEINAAATSTQANPVQTIQLPGQIVNSDPTQAQALRINGSGGTTGYLATSSDGSLLAVVAANALNNTDLTQTTAASILNRAVVTLGAAGNLTFQAHYTGGTGNQARAATSLDNTLWFVADKGGIYTTSAASPATTADSTTNMLNAKSFGGLVYGFSASSPGVSGIVSSGAGIGTLSTLTGLSVSNDTDFHFISSGINGAAFDICYVCLGSSTTAGNIYKFSLVNGSWVANGSYATNFGGRSMVAAGSGTGAVLYLTGGDGGHSGVSVVKLTDTASWNSAISINTASNVVLYTFAGGSTGPIAKGIAFAPTSTALADLTIAASVPATSSSTFSYTLTLANSGAANATGVTAQFTLPTGITYVSATDNGGNGFTASNNNGVITFSGGTLNANSSDTITVAVTAASPTTYIVDAGSSAATAGDGFATINTTVTASPGSPIPESNTANNGSPVSAPTTVVSTSINVVGTPTALSTTYGTPSSPTTFSVSGSSLTDPITITAPAGFEVSTSAGSGYVPAIPLPPTGGTVASTTIYVRLAATATAGAHSGNVVLTSTGAATQNAAIPSSSVSQLALTVNNANVVPKPWDGTTSATIIGNLVGVVNGDTVNFVGTGNFASSADGNGIAVNSTSTITGAGAGNYILTQPTGLTGNILPSANLSALALSAGSYTTAFSSSNTSYNVYLPGTTTSITLTPTSDAGAVVKVNGSSPSTPVSLSPGLNTIVVSVGASSGGGTQTYTVAVYVAGAFTQGDLVVTTYGNTAPATPHPDGPATLITLEEFNPAIVANSTPVMALVLPSSANGANAGIVGEYGSSSEGTIQLTDDGQHLTIGGYSSIPGEAYTATALAQSTDTQVPRVAALIDVNGNVDTTSVFNDIYTTNNPRCVYSPDDINLYLSGQGAGSNDEGGIYYTHLGTNTVNGGAAPTGIINVVSTRTLFSYQGNLYYSADQNSSSKGTQTGIFEYSGEPTTSQATMSGTNIGTRLTPANDGGSVNYSPDGFFFANATTLYVADTGLPKAGGTGDGGIQKWVYNGSAWVLQYTLTTPNFVAPSQTSNVNHGETGFASLTGTVVSGTAYLYTTSYTAGDADPDGLYAIADTLSSTTGAGETFTEIATAPGLQSSGTNPDYVFKGVSFAPIPAPVNTAGGPTGVTSSGANLNGTVNPNGSDTHVYFQYGTTTAYGMTSGTLDIGSGNTPIPFQLALAGLQPGTTYDYRLVSDGATVYYGNQTFTTPAEVPAMPRWALAALAGCLVLATAFSRMRKKENGAS